MPTSRVSVVLALFLSFGHLPIDAQERCGGTERWAVKVGTDTGASMVDLANPATKTIHELIAITKPSIPNDEVTRTPAERNVYVVDGRLLKFKLESGQTGDQDYHLVITDSGPMKSGTEITLTPRFAHAGTYHVAAEVTNPQTGGSSYFLN